MSCVIPLCNREHHHLRRRLCRQPAHRQADRGRLWPGEDHRLHAHESVCRPSEVGLSVCPDLRGLQPGSVSQPGGGGLLLWWCRGVGPPGIRGSQPKTPIRAALGDMRPENVRQQDRDGR